MQLDELVAELKRMYDEGAKEGDRSAMHILFGIKYAKQIRACGETPAMIAKLATDNPRSGYGSDINKGMLLARHVCLKPPKAPKKTNPLGDE